jgi:hypothetical protein
MAKREIVFWHGAHKSIEDKIKSFCTLEGDVYFWSGSLDEFEQKLNGMFIVYSDMIAVTHKKSFNQC